LNWWQRYQRFLQLALAVILLVTAISFINRERERYLWPETVLRKTLGPIQGVVQVISHRLKGAVAGIVELWDLRDENRFLREELGRRDFVYALLREIRAENTRLLKLIDLQETLPTFETTAARVIAREPGNWYNTITINKGSRHGLGVNMPVITHRGLVGRIMSLDNSQAEVLLLLDQRSSVGGMIQTTREPGVVKGFAGEKERLRLLYLPRDAHIRTGESVVTSGLGGIFPKGLLIGSVADVKTEEYGLAQYAVIEAAADFDHLEEVLVVVSGEGVDEGGDERE
jgi:rod shape-determining protein MreC